MKNKTIVITGKLQVYLYISVYSMTAHFITLHYFWVEVTGQTEKQQNPFKCSIIGFIRFIYTLYFFCFFDHAKSRSADMILRFFLYSLQF